MTVFIQFTTKSGPQINLDVIHANKIILEAHETKYLGLIIDNTLSRKSHIEQTLHKLTAACYALKPHVS
jgi:hypothetical protein